MLQEKGRKFDDKEIDVLVSMRGEMKKKDGKIEKLLVQISEMLGNEDCNVEFSEDEEEAEVKEANERIKAVELREIEEEAEKREQRLGKRLSKRQERSKRRK